MSKRSDPAAFARAAGARDPLNLADPAPAPDLVPLPEVLVESANALAVPVAPAAAPPAFAEADAPTGLTPYIDENGFDPADYKWIPVRRQRQHRDGWTEAKQRRFIEELADTACVEQAARAVGMSISSAYGLRRAPGGEQFAAAWNAALQQGALKLVDLAFDRAIHGSDEPVFDKEGRRVGRRMRQNDRLLMFLLRAHLPERYRHAHRDARLPNEAAPPAVEPLAQAIARLEPVTPPDPHLLLAPEDLDVEVQVADLCDGRLPHWRDPVPRDPAPVESPLGEAFERALEAAKNGMWPLEDEEDEESAEDEEDEEDALDDWDDFEEPEE